MAKLIAGTPLAAEPVSRLYELSSTLGDSPTSTLYLGRILRQPESRLIVVGKTRLDPVGPQARHFVARVTTLRSFFERNPSSGSLCRGELDSDGFPFLELPRISGKPYPIIQRSHVEADRRLMSLVRAINLFHADGIWFGDLTPSSFFADASLDPFVVGMIGLTGPMTISSNKIGQVVFLAPEVRRGQPSSPASDVFSLCMLGAVLFGLKVQPQEVIRAVEVREKLEHAGMPEWLCTIVCHGLAPYPGDRPADCCELFELIQKSREGQLTGSLMIREMQLAPNDEQVGESATEPEAFASVAVTSAPGRSRAFSKVVVASAVFAILFIGVVFYRQGISKSGSGQGAIGQGMVLLRQAGFSAEMNESERSQFFQRLDQTADPTVLDAVMVLIEQARTVDERVAAERWLLERYDKLGMHRSVGVVRRWFGDDPLLRPRGYLASLRALDRSAPREVHEQMIQELARSHKGVATELAVALLIDWGGREPDRRVLSSIISGVPDDRDILERPVTALVLGLLRTRQSFPLDVHEALSSLDGKDILWVLNRIIQDDDDAELSGIVAASLASPNLSPHQKELIELGISHDKAPKAARIAVIRFAGGEVNQRDIDRLGLWQDIRAAKILLLLTQSVVDDVAVRNILRILFTKKIDSEPAQTMLEILRSASEEEILATSRVPGYFYELTRKQQLPKTVDVELVGAMATIPALLKAVVDSSCEICHEVLIDTIPEKISSSMLFRLLRVGSFRIRIKSLQRLGQYADVGAVNLLRLSYEQEKDEEVRKIYRSSFPHLFGS